MSKRNKKKTAPIEVPQIGEPLENPNFVTPTALTDPRNIGTQPFPGPLPVPAMLPPDADYPVSELELD